MDTFHAWSTDHLVALAVITAICIVIARWGVRLTPGTRRAVRWLLAGLLTGYLVSASVYLTLQGRRWLDVLPLHLCDLLVLVCIVALATRARLPAEVAYYWGLTGAGQALLTPDLRTGFPSFAFIHFFLGHGALLSSVTWLTAVEGTGPRTGSVLRAFLALQVYLITVGVLDGIFGWNYGYLCRRPAHPSVLDYLGPWPSYIVVGDFLVLPVFVALYLPWSRYARGCMDRRCWSSKTSKGSGPH